MNRKIDIKEESEALSAINEIVNSGNKAEVFHGKSGVVILEIKRKLKYEHGMQDER